jgi:hypothetical protein
MKSVYTVLGVIVVTALMRLVPHVPNFVPITAAAVFAGAKLDKKWVAIAVILSSMLLSDLVLGFHATQPVVYLALVLSVFIGGGIGAGVGSIVGASLASSVTFFVLTNLGTFLLQDMYPKTGAGLVACFTAAIPFFTYSVSADLFYTAVLFGAFALFVAQDRVAVAAR